jgi:hypothetical protein
MSGPADRPEPAGDDYVLLDPEDRIVRVGPALDAAMGPFVGQSLWERLPGAQPVYGPRFDEARRTGETVEFTVFYAAQLKRIRATPVGAELVVHVTRIRELDVTSLGTLAASLREMTSELTDPRPGPPDRPAPASLRALP